MLAVTDLLRNLPLFRGLAADELAALARLMAPRTAKKEETILAELEPGDSLFVIAAGKVKVSLIGESGREVILSVLGPGEFFGEMSLLDGEPRTATAVTLAPTQVLMLTTTDFTRVLESMPSVDRKLLTVLAKRLRDIEARYVPASDLRARSDLV